jgi:hypothetical protein
MLEIPTFIHEGERVGHSVEDGLSALGGITVVRCWTSDVVAIALEFEDVD